MDKEKLYGLLVTDFNDEVLANQLNSSETLPALEAVSAPFNQVMPVLMSPSHPAYQGKDFLFIWTQPERLFDSFRRFCQFENVTSEEILKEVDEFCQCLRLWENHTGAIFVATWIMPVYQHKINVLQGMNTGRGLAYILMKMNIRLAENLADCKSIHLLNSQPWVEAIGRNAFNSKLWYMGKIPFDPAVFKEAANDIKAALRGIKGLSHKLIVLDLDDTLWGGMVGDDGWENIRLGGHDSLGEAFVDFQQALKMLKRQGVLLAIVSKNNEATALEAIRNHPEMILKEEDFVGWKINWNDKAQNIAELVAELNVGLQSVVFIDDNPLERARVREMLPEVLVPEWPQDKTLYRRTLLSLSSFDQPTITSEDLQRSTFYAQERTRKDVLAKIDSIEEWVKNLGVKVEISPFSKTDLSRTTQLLNKTNQMNLSTRRLTEGELTSWIHHPSRKLWTFRVSDKFGDSGLTGIASLEINGSVGYVIDFILSCRVFGRKVEDQMFYTIYDHAQQCGLTQLQAKYIPTDKNKPCLEFLQRLPWQESEPNVFVWHMTQPFSPPQHLALEISHGPIDVERTADIQ